MNPSINKLFDDNGNALIIPVYCVLKVHQEKVNEKGKSFEKMAFWAFCQGSDNAKIQCRYSHWKSENSNQFLQVLCAQNRKVANIFSLCVMSAHKIKKAA